MSAVTGPHMHNWKGVGQRRRRFFYSSPGEKSPGTRLVKPTRELCALYQDQIEAKDCQMAQLMAHQLRGESNPRMPLPCRLYHRSNDEQQDESRSRCDMPESVRSFARASRGTLLSERIARRSELTLEITVKTPFDTAEGKIQDEEQAQAEDHRRYEVIKQKEIFRA